MPRKVKIRVFRKVTQHPATAVGGPAQLQAPLALHWEVVLQALQLPVAVGDAAAGTAVRDCHCSGS